MNHTPYNPSVPLYVARPFGGLQQGDLFVPADHNVSQAHVEAMYDTYWISHVQLGQPDKHDIVLTTSGFALRTNGVIICDGLPLAVAQENYFTAHGKTYDGEIEDVRPANWETAGMNVTIAVEDQATCANSAQVEEQPAMAGEGTLEAEIDAILNDVANPEPTETPVLSLEATPEDTQRRRRNRGGNV